MTFDEKLHVEAGKYATSRKEAYKLAMKEGRVESKSEDFLNWLWLAHHEGWKAGALAAQEACARLCDDSVEYAADELARQIRAMETI